MRRVRCLLVEHRVAARGEPGVEANPELGDHVGALTGVGDEIAEHLSGAAALDRGHAAGFEPERDRLVDEAFDRVGNRQVGDEDAVSAVFQWGDEDLSAGEIGTPAGLERQRVAQPRAAVDAEREVGAGASPDPDLLRPFELGEQPTSRLLELGLRLARARPPVARA